MHKFKAEVLIRKEKLQNGLDDCFATYFLPYSDTSTQDILQIFEKENVLFANYDSNVMENIRMKNIIHIALCVYVDKFKM